MSPEIYGNKRFGFTADIYSLGMVMFWLLNEKRLPFYPMPPEKISIQDEQNALSRRLHGDVCPLPLHGSTQLKKIVLKACEFDPKDRWQNADEMRSALECLSKQPSAVSKENKNIKFILPIVAVVLLLTICTLIVVKPRPLSLELPAGEEATLVTENTPEVISIPVPTSRAAPSLSPVSTLNPAYIARGRCGDNAEWKLTADGTLYISGNGIVTGYEYDSALDEHHQPWSAQYIDAVIIENGIEGIGAYAFANCRSMTSITIPDSVTSIGEAAFEQCTSLSHLEIPDSVAEIGDWAFCGCESLSNVFFPKTVTSVGYGVFCSCSNLSSVNIPNGVTYIGESAFDECIFSSVTIPNSVTYIGGAFHDCPNLKEIYFSGSKAEWTAIEIAPANDSLHQAKVIFNEIYPKVSAGWVHSLYLGEPCGKVVTTGSNEYRAYNLSNWTDIVAISAGERHTLGLRADGTVIACGSNEYGQCDVGAWRDVVSISAGSKHSLGGCSDGGVYAAGSNENNQLCIATKTLEATAPQAQTVLNVADEDVFPMIEGIRFNFSSGVGAWRTVLTIAGDGNFTGKYSDSDSDIRYECEFSGRFKNAKKVDDYTYSFELDYLNREGPKEEYVDEFGIRVVPSEPYGLKTGKNYMLYLPGSAMNTLPEEFVSWISLPNAWYSNNRPVFLSFFGIYNVDSQYGFYEEKG